jgi:hypothetical protein
MLLTKGGMLVILLLTNILFMNNPLIHICDISLKNHLIHERPFQQRRCIVYE